MTAITANARSRLIMDVAFQILMVAGDGRRPPKREGSGRLPIAPSRDVVHPPGAATRGGHRPGQATCGTGVAAACRDRPHIDQAVEALPDRPVEPQPARAKYLRRRLRGHR